MRVEWRRSAMRWLYICELFSHFDSEEKWVQASSATDIVMYKESSKCVHINFMRCWFQFKHGVTLKSFVIRNMLSIRDFFQPNTVCAARIYKQKEREGDAKKQVTRNQLKKRKREKLKKKTLTNCIHLLPFAFVNIPCDSAPKEFENKPFHKWLVDG